MAAGIETAIREIALDDEIVNFPRHQKITAEQNLDSRCSEHRMGRYIVPAVDALNSKGRELDMRGSSLGARFAKKWRCERVEGRSLEVHFCC